MFLQELIQITYSCLQRVSHAGLSASRAISRFICFYPRDASPVAARELKRDEDDTPRSVASEIQLQRVDSVPVRREPTLITKSVQTEDPHPDYEIVIV